MQPPGVEALISSNAINSANVRDPPKLSPDEIRIKQTIKEWDSLQYYSTLSAAYYFTTDAKKQVIELIKPHLYELDEWEVLTMLATMSLKEWKAAMDTLPSKNMEAIRTRLLFTALELIDVPAKGS